MIISTKNFFVKQILLKLKIFQLFFLFCIDYEIFMKYPQNESEELCKIASGNALCVFTMTTTLLSGLPKSCSCRSRLALLLALLFSLL